MRNLIKLQSSLIAQKWFLIHTVITLAAILTSFIVFEFVGGMSGWQIAWAIVAWIPLISFMQISKRIERDAIHYVQNRIPNDIELCSEKDLIVQLAVRNEGCVVFLIKDGRPMTFEKFESEDQRELASKMALGWVTDVHAGIKAKRDRES